MGCRVVDKPTHLRCGTGGSGRLRGLRLQSGTLCRPSLGFLFFQGSGGCCLPQGSFQRPGGKLGPGGLGRDGSQEASAGPGKVSAWRERKQVAEASPAPCLETFPGVCSRQCPWDSGPGLQGREGHRGLQQALQLTQEVLGNWSQGPVKAVGTMSPTFRCAGTFSGPRPQHLWPGPWQQDILTTILPFCLCPPCPGPLLTTMRDKRLRRKLN